MNNHSEPVRLKALCAGVFLFASISACGGSNKDAATAVQEPTSPVSVPTMHPPGLRGVDHVGLTVTKLEKSKAFFTGVLGFSVAGKDEDYPAYFLNNGHTTITLWRAKKPESAVAFDRGNNVGLHHLALAVSSFAELDALYEKVRAYNGSAIEFAPELAYDGPAKHMMFYEPSGNRIEIVHRPKRTP